jgi:hypothetical protein
VHQKLEEVLWVDKVPKKEVHLKETRMFSSKMKGQYIAQHLRKEVKETPKMKMIEKNQRKMIN